MFLHLQHRKLKLTVELPDAATHIEILKPAKGGECWVVMYKIDGVTKIKKTDIPVVKELRVISCGVRFLQNPKARNSFDMPEKKEQEHNPEHERAEIFNAITED